MSEEEACHDRGRRFACACVATQIFIKTEHGLWVSPTEHDARVATLEECGARPLGPKPRSMMVRL